MGTHDRQYVIIGAGVAGLSTAMRLLECGVQPIVIDGGSFPSHKVCGEFFSPECLDLLDRWDMLPKTTIRRIEFHVGERVYPFKLPEEARSESHYTFDTRFIEKIRQKGGLVKTGVPVQSIKDECIILSNGEVYPFDALFLGTGRLTGNIVECQYVGMKTQLAQKGYDLLQMHLVSGGYYGISPINDEEVNIAFLSRGSNVKSPFEAEWMEVKVPEFGMATPSKRKNVYLIGDAQTRIPPCSGDGLAMGITGGVLAADLALKNCWEDYQITWEKRYKKRLRWALRVHQLMMRPRVALGVLEGLSLFPKGFQFLYESMRSVKR